MFGFAMLSIAFGSLQLMLDRGKIKDWFHSTVFFFFNDTATTEIYTLSLHDALPICSGAEGTAKPASADGQAGRPPSLARRSPIPPDCPATRGTTASDASGVIACVLPAVAAAAAAACPPGRVCQRA